MKARWFLSYSMVLALLATAQVAQAGPSISSAEALSSLMEELAEAASEGASLAYFGYSEESTFPGPLSRCTRVGSERIEAHFMSLVDMILADRADPRLAAALGELRAIVGHGKYLECADQLSGERSVIHRTFFIGLDRHYRLMLETGWED